MKKFIKGFVIVVVIFVGFILFALSHQIGGWRAFIVSSGSMEPTLQTGSLVVTKYTHPSILKKDDIITFIAPTKEKPLVTHRITTISQKKSLTTMKTKGDNNKNEDTWILAGGSVVGKSLFSIPYLGYLFNFTQTKIGILLFILLPAIYIILDEISTIIKTLKEHKKKPAEHKEAVAALLLILLSVASFAPQSTQALLSDKATLVTNTFTIVTPTPTITPTDTPTSTPTPTVSPSLSPTVTPSTTPSNCNGNTTIIISNNGSGSTNVVTTSTNCTTTVNQSNNMTNNNTVTSHTSTGGNSVTNSSGTMSVTSGSVNNTTIITNTGGSNQVRH